MTEPFAQWIERDVIRVHGPDMPTPDNADPDVGTYTFVANMPNGQGLLPAVWAAYLNPWLPEIDAAEIVGQSPNTVYQTFHDWNNVQTTFTRANSSGWTNAYHTYSFTWWPDHIDFWVDGVFSGTKWYSTGNGIGMHFIVDTAVGGNWPGNPSASTWATADGARRRLW